MKVPVLSIVIGFRDWGLDRLVTVIRSHFLNAHLCGIQIEVIVSDYGSTNPNAVQNAIQPFGARVVRTDTSGVWSRAASLNAGVSAALSPSIVTTDADIVCMPSTFIRLVKQMAVNPWALYLTQCRDLPDDYDIKRISYFLEGDWERDIARARECSVLRPRWGMGGFAAFSSTVFAAVNGYDERMKVWGGEDKDFANRVRRAGFPVRWSSRPDVCILHVWHESSENKAIETDDGKAAVRRNRSIVSSDQTVCRNLPASIRVSELRPLVSIVIPTYRRSQALYESISSCLSQTFEDFEVLVVENAEANDAPGILDNLNDSRIRYLSAVGLGAAATRNHALNYAAGRYVVFQEEGDIMVSTRLEHHLAAMRSDCHGSYGGWIDIENRTIKTAARHSGKEFSCESLLHNSNVFTHDALMLDRRVFSMFRYDERLAEDFENQFVLLLARNGLRLNHTGTYLTIRLRSRAKNKEDEIVGAKGTDALSIACQNEALALAALSPLRLESGHPEGENFLGVNYVDGHLDSQNTIHDREQRKHGADRRMSLQTIFARLVEFFDPRRNRTK